LGKNGKEFDTGGPGKHPPWGKTNPPTPKKGAKPQGGEPPKKNGAGHNRTGFGGEH